MSRDYQGEFQRMQEKIRSQGAGGMYGNGDLEAIVNDSIADARIHRELVAQDHLQRRELAVEDVQLIKDVIAKGASDGELRLFVQICNRTGLDPFLHQIWLIPRRSKVGTDSHGKDIWQTSMQPQVSIDGLRLLAQRTGRYAGQIGPLWCGEDGEWKDVWFGEAPPAAAKVGVRSKSFTEPLWAVARWDSYHLDTKFWRDSPDNQLAICAERIALRKAFPAELAGFSVRDVDSDDEELVPAEL